MNLRYNGQRVGVGLGDKFGDELKEEEEKFTGYIDSIKSLPGAVTAGLVATGAVIGGCIVYFVTRRR